MVVTIEKTDKRIIIDTEEIEVKVLHDKKEIHVTVKNRLKLNSDKLMDVLKLVRNNTDYNYLDIADFDYYFFKV